MRVLTASADVYSDVPVAQKIPLVRVVEHNTRTLPLSKVDIQNILVDDEEDENVLDEAAGDVVQQLMALHAQKIIKEELSRDGAFDIDPVIEVDEEVDEVTNAVLEWEDAREEAASLYDDNTLPPEEAFPESLLRSDDEDLFQAEEFIVVQPPVSLLESSIEDVEDAIEDLKYECQKCYEEEASTSCVRPAHTRNVFEEVTTMPTEPIRRTNPDNPTLRNLKSVEGRILTLMEVAFPETTQRDAIKSLIKKEFRREMNKVNRTPDEDDE